MESPTKGILRKELLMKSLVIPLWARRKVSLKPSTTKRNCSNKERLVKSMDFRLDRSKTKSPLFGASMSTLCKASILGNKMPISGTSSNFAPGLFFSLIILFFPSAICCSLPKRIKPTSMPPILMCISLKANKVVCSSSNSNFPAWILPLSMSKLNSSSKLLLRSPMLTTCKSGKVSLPTDMLRSLLSLSENNLILPEINLSVSPAGIIKEISP